MEEQPVTAPLEEAEPEKPKKVNLTLVAGAALVIVALVVGLQLCQSERFRPVGKGSPAPNFTLNALDGGSVTMEGLRGKVVFLNIWATWCEPCREEMPSMERLYKRLQGRPFEILAVSVDSDSSPVKPFRDEFKLTFPILLDARKKITRLYRATGVPETFIIDADGVIVEKVIGARNWSSKESFETILRLVEGAEGFRQAEEARPAPVEKASR
jgi:peroxiredoxin